jgi:hypothetical protein
MARDLTRLSEDELRRSTVGRLATYRQTKGLPRSLRDWGAVLEAKQEWLRRGNRRGYYECEEAERAEHDDLQRANRETLERLRGGQN